MAVAKEVALRARRFPMENLGKGKGVTYKGSGHFNTVSAMGTGAERIIVDAVGSAFPEHNILTEEKREAATQSDLAPTAIPPVKS